MFGALCVLYEILRYYFCLNVFIYADNFVWGKIK